MSPKQIIEAYTAAAHKVQSAIAILMARKAPYAPVQPKHLRVGIDMSKADMKGLARLLIEKGCLPKTNTWKPYSSLPKKKLLITSALFVKSLPILV